MNDTIDILWTETSLIITDLPDSLKATLSYWHKSLEFDPKAYDRKSKKERVLLYRQMDGRRIVTYHGFLDRILARCASMGLNYVLRDARQKMPVPNWRATGNFRFGQAALFFEFLSKNRSGICQAPTRYGKTVLMANLMRVYNTVRTVVTAPGINLLAQLEQDLKKWLPGRDIKGLYTGSRNKKISEDITVVSMDSLEKCEPGSVRLLIIDEPHAIAAPSRIHVMSRFENARIAGFGATLTGRFDGSDVLVEGSIGPVLACKTYTAAVAEGAICQIVVYGVKVPFAPFDATNREWAYKTLLYRNKHFNMMVREITRTAVPKEWQTLIFVDEIKQADLMQALIEEGVVAVASRMNAETRKQMYNDMQSGAIKRCMATDIYATGITFPDLRVLVNTCGGGGAITATQKPGRLAQMRPGKKAGYVIDFMFESRGQIMDDQSSKGWEQVVRDCQARFDNYKKTGFTVKMVDSITDIVLE